MTTSAMAKLVIAIDLFVLFALFDFLSRPFKGLLAGGVTTQIGMLVPVAGYLWLAEVIVILIV